MVHLRAKCNACGKFIVKNYPEFKDDSGFKSLQLVCGSCGGSTTLLTEAEMEAEISRQIDEQRALAEAREEEVEREIYQNKKKILRWLAPLIKYGLPFFIAYVSTPYGDDAARFFVFFVSVAFLNLAAWVTNDFLDFP